MPRRSAAPALFLTVALGGCGGASTPAAPTPRIATSPAMLQATMTVSSTLTSSGGYRYEIHLELSESAGVAATLECVQVFAGDWGDALATLCGADVWPDGNAIPATGVVRSRPIVVEEQFPYEYYREFAATIAFRDGAGLVPKSLLTTATAPSIPQPPAGAKFVVTGIVFEEGTGRRLDGVTVQVVAGRNAGRTTTTDIDGQYTFTDLATDGFSMTFSRTGYVGTGTWVELASNRTLNYQLGRQN